MLSLLDLATNSGERTPLSANNNMACSNVSLNCHLKTKQRRKSIKSDILSLAVLYTYFITSPTWLSTKR